MRLCVFGGHFGSEGKGSMAEHLAKDMLANKPAPGCQLIVIGENSPNSGHTCSLGKTRNIPASSFWADVIILGPDSVIDRDALKGDLDAVNAERAKSGKDPIPVYIHEHAALMPDGASAEEARAGVITRISSTGSGSGAARNHKYFNRIETAIVKCWVHCLPNVQFINTSQYLRLLASAKNDLWLFECSQGVMLDPNFGYFPFVTSRTTLPQAALARNGLLTNAGPDKWQYCGVYRTFPIRTGGPSGPTGANEVTFSEVGVEPEIATVTRRTRRIFEFSSDDFLISMWLSRPDTICFTHLDYIKVDPADLVGFEHWLDHVGIGLWEMQQAGVTQLALSNKLGEFTFHPLAAPAKAIAIETGNPAAITDPPQPPIPPAPEVPIPETPVVPEVPAELVVETPAAVIPVTPEVTQ